MVQVGGCFVKGAFLSRLLKTSGSEMQGISFDFACFKSVFFCFNDVSSLLKESFCKVRKMGFGAVGEAFLALSFLFMEQVCEFSLKCTAPCWGTCLACARTPFFMHWKPVSVRASMCPSHSLLTMWAKFWGERCWFLEVTHHSLSTGHRLGKTRAEQWLCLCTSRTKQERSLLGLFSGVLWGLTNPLMLSP